jgi:hypothetical protein
MGYHLLQLTCPETCIHLVCQSSMRSGVITHPNLDWGHQ